MNAPHWLKNLKVWSVALVDRGANPDAHVVLMKSDAKTKTVSGTTLHAADFAHVGDPNDPASWKLPIHDASHVRNALARFNQTEGMSSEDKAKAKAKILAAAKTHGIDATETKKFIDQTPEPSDQADAKSGPVGDEDDATKTATMPVECDICGGDHATGDHDSAIAKQPGLSDVHAPAPNLSKREFSMDTQASVEKMAGLQKRLDETTAANAALAERVEKMEAKQRRDRYIQKAALYKHIPGALPEDFGPILAKIDGVLNEAEREKFDKVLGATEAALRQAAIFQEFGRSGDADGTEPGNALTKLAKAKQVADPKLTFSEAYAVVLRENPSIYDQYLVEKARR